LRNRSVPANGERGDQTGGLLSATSLRAASQGFASPFLIVSAILFQLEPCKLVSVDLVGPVGDRQHVARGSADDAVSDFPHPIPDGIGSSFVGLLPESSARALLRVRALV
jgi:hypothetical protein